MIPPILPKKRLLELVKVTCFPCSWFPEEGLSLDSFFALPLTARGRGMMYLPGSRGKALRRDLLRSVLLPGSVRKPVSFSH